MNSLNPGSPVLYRCPICDGERSWAVPFRDQASGELQTRKQGYHWRLCSKCGNAFPSKAFSLHELQEYWDRNRVETDDAAEVSDAVWESRWRASQVWAQRTHDFVAPYLNNDMTRFLDIACGLGAMVALFRDKGWHAEGVDADPNTRQFHEKAGVSVTIGQVENLESGASFDLVSIAHAIYFVTQPRQFVQRVGAMLRSGGLFVVTLSDLLSSLSDGSPGYVHTWYPTTDSLIYLLEQEGFAVVARRSLKGSTMVLLRRGQVALPVGHPYRAYLAHLTQAWRFRLIGRPRRWLVNGLKSLLRRAG